MPLIQVHHDHQNLIITTIMFIFLILLHVSYLCLWKNNIGQYKKNQDVVIAVDIQLSKKKNKADVTPKQKKTSRLHAPKNFKTYITTFLSSSNFIVFLDTSKKLAFFKDYILEPNFVIICHSLYCFSIQYDLYVFGFCQLK